MLQVLGWVLLAVLVGGALCALAVFVLPAGEQIAPALRDEPVWSLPPERALKADDVDTVRLPVSLRGYRFAETDQLLDRLASELRARDAVIARLGTSPIATEVRPLPADESPAAAADDQPAGDEPAEDQSAGDEPYRRP